MASGVYILEVGGFSVSGNASVTIAGTNQTAAQGP